MSKYLFLIVLICSLGATTGANAALVYGATGQNLVRDTNSGLLWLAPTASAEEVTELSNFGSNVRIATNAEVAALFSTYFEFTPGVQSVDPALMAFLEFAISGSNTSVPSTCSRLGYPQCTGFFAWSLGEGFIDQQPLSSANFTGNFFGYDADFGVNDLWDFNSTQTLGSYPIDPCDTSLFEVCSTSAFRIMNPVPLPGAVWFFWSGLLTLVAFGRRKAA